MSKQVEGCSNNVNRVRQSVRIRPEIDSKYVRPVKTRFNMSKNKSSKVPKGSNIAPKGFAPPPTRELQGGGAVRRWCREWPVPHVTGVDSHNQRAINATVRAPPRLKEPASPKIELEVPPRGGLSKELFP
eukprot:1155775-Prorocentrum_minimum.AAC.1